MSSTTKKNIPTQLLDLLIEPSSKITSDRNRQNARLLSGLLFFLAAMLAATFFNDIPGGTLAFSSSILAYLVSRTRYYRLGIFFALAALSFPSVVAILTVPSETLSQLGSATQRLGWLIIVLILASLGTQAWITGIITSVFVGLTLSLLVIRPEVNTIDIGWLAAVFGVSGGLLAIASGIRNDYLRQIEIQKEALQNQEQKLRFNEKRYRDLVENISDIVYRVDAKGYFTYVSPSASILSGYREDQLIGMHFTKLVEPSSRQMLIDLYTMQIKELEPETTVAFRSVKADGEIRWVEQTTTLMLNDDGTPQGFQSILRDITERRQLEEKLRLNTKAVESGLSGIVIADAQQDDIPLIYINPAFEKMTGYSAEEVIGRNCRFLQGDDHAQPALNVLRSAIKQGKACVVILRNYRKDGTMFWNELSINPILDDNGAITHFVGIQNDITERVEAEQQIQSQNESLVKANREIAIARKQAEAGSKLKSQFLATMSHELRTPLNAVIGYAQLQLAGMVGEMSQEQLGFQERILANAQHLLQLINEVLDLSKIEAGRLELMEKPYDLRILMLEITMQNEVLADTKGLKFESIVDDRLPETLIGDRERIKQVIINLLSNAIKFTDEGSVTINTALYNKDSWRITVTDTGVGISPTMQETVFDEFRQAENGIDRGGTGLGLAIVRKLVLMMGGNIRLTSEVGQGSTFTVTLPLITKLQETTEIIEALEG